MDSIYLEFYGEANDCYIFPVESGVFVFVSQWCVSSLEDCSKGNCSCGSNITSLCFNLVKTRLEYPSSTDFPKSVFHGAAIREVKTIGGLPESVQQCVLPAILTQDRQLCITGLSNVLRYILKHSPHENCKQLLGFRQGCLMACAEKSVWTRFCEIELLNSAKRYQGTPSNYTATSLPIDVLKFECHLKESLRTHNISKRRHEVAKELRNQQLLLKEEHSRYLKKEANIGHMEKVLELPHTYAEGSTMTLADVVIYFCVHHILYRLHASWDHLSEKIPTITKWYNMMANNPEIVNASKVCQLPGIPHVFDVKAADCSVNITVPSIMQQGLYLRQPGSKPKLGTKQMYIDSVIDKLKRANIMAIYDNTPEFLMSSLPWSEMPAFVQPTFGNLPESRLLRKCQQLQNMAMSVCKLAVEGDVIVDFCSGGGHLGILVAYLLPKCHIVLIENKEESVTRALRRAKHLPNVTIYQCNLDYFRGKFDVGIGLHACGTATDLMIERCLEVSATFVVCPCCYGSLCNTDNITYPRSQPFRDAGVSLLDYYFLSHAADQTHDKGHKTAQGKCCMGLVDLDRGLKAKAMGYHIKLFTMTPSSSTPKNNVLLGISKERLETIQERVLDWM